MQEMNDDTALLRQYAEDGSESAFTELVRRHIDLVYTVGLRRTGGDAFAAADISQQVFTKMARHASRLSRHTVLSAWLHVATRNAAVDLMRAEQRRKAREATAVSLQAATGLPPEWEKIRPLLDSAVDDLPDADRAVVVLRFMQQKPFADIGRVLQLSEDAARMRTERALDKLRGLLVRRGIDSTSAALTIILANQPLIAAPAGVAAMVSAQSLAAAGGVGGVAALVSLMTTKSIITGGVVAAIGIGVGIFLRDQGIVGGTSPTPVAAGASENAQQVTALQRSNQSLLEETDKLNAEIARLSGANALLAVRADAEMKRASVKPGPIIGFGSKKWEQQVEIMNYLRQVAAARDQAILDGKPAKSVRDLAGVSGYIRSIRPVANEDYSELSMEKGKPLTVTTAEGLTVTFDPAGETTTPIDYPPEVQAARKLEQQMGELAQKGIAARQKAIEAYRVANQGKNPPPQNAQALIPYFGTPQEGADYVEFLEAQKAAAEAMKAATAKGQ